MVYSTATRLVLNNLCYFPEKGTTLSEKLKDCYRQFIESSSEHAKSRISVIKQTIFITSGNKQDYIQSKQKLLSCAKDFFGETPPTSVVSQSPEKESLAVEFILMEGLQPADISHRQNAENSWLIIDKCDMKILIASGAGDMLENTDILARSNQAFNRIRSVLDEEKMEFSDIIRQWNFIEQITMEVRHNNSASQHYQVFNDVRSKYYQQADFINGYPAATGIGMDCGGIIIDVIAAKFGIECSTVAIKSPVQKDAYSYTKEVLAENSSMNDFCRTSPKFERAKILITPSNKWIFISGTAAIKGQVSIPVLSADQQTELTIQNILNLISVENMHKHGIKSSENAKIDYLRVYVKYQQDIPAVKNMCQKYFPATPSVYIVADICRPELLVEIEGMAMIR